MAPQASLLCWRAVSGCPDISAGGVMSLSLIRLSRIPRLESRQIQRKLRAAQNGFCCPYPCDARRDVPSHLTLLRYSAALAGTARLDSEGVISVRLVA